VWGSEFTAKAATLQAGVIVVFRQLFAAALVVRLRNLIMMPRPLPVAPLVVRRRYLIVVPRPTPAAQRMYLIVVYRPFLAEPLVVRCMYMVVVPGTDACGRSCAVLSTQVSAVGLRLRHNRLACGIMLEVSRDAFAAGEEELVSCATEPSNIALSVQ
jgi:hypothetical protein